MFLAGSKLLPQRITINSALCGDSDISHVLLILPLPANLGISFLFSFANYSNLIMYARFLMCSKKSVASAQVGPQCRGTWLY